MPPSKQLEEWIRVLISGMLPRKSDALLLGQALAHAAQQ
tara:strand:+ start:1835 stop:1951 length:117 start_codon:yes stop_codon:yes gene_type:complete